MADLHMMLVDGKVVEVDMEPMLRRFRDRHIQLRADAVGGLVDALAIESLDVMEICGASGLPEADREAAAGVALVLELAELGEIGELDGE